MIKNFLRGLLFGTVVGGAAGLLLAPKSGKETVQGLTARVDSVNDTILNFSGTVEGVNSSTHELVDSLADFKDSLVTLKSTVETVVPAFKNGIEDDIETFKFQAEPRLNQIKDQTEKIQDHLQVFEEVVNGRYHLKRPLDLKETN